MAKYKIIPSSRTIVQSPISIGHKAEKGVEAIEFDLTAWVETYGSGTLTVIMRRWGDAIPYPIALEIDENNKATWTLSDTDTAKAGMAYAQLSYIVGDTVVKKSDIYTFRVMDSLTGGGEPPEAYESWLEHLTHFAAEAMAGVLDIEGVVTDKTLTVDGGIADAKAAGDALALKADKSTTYTKTEVDQMIDDVEVETDTTLTETGKPADAAETGRQIGLLKADLDDVYNGDNGETLLTKSDVVDRYGKYSTNLLYSAANSMVGKTFPDEIPTQTTTGAYTVLIDVEGLTSITYPKIKHTSGYGCLVLDSNYTVLRNLPNITDATGTIATVMFNPGDKYFLLAVSRGLEETNWTLTLTSAPTKGLLTVSSELETVSADVDANKNAIADLRDMVASTPNLDAEIVGFICYGQSWSMGYDTQAISGSQRYDNIMLGTGLMNNPATNMSVNATDFAPLAESTVWSNANQTQRCGETPCTAQTDIVKQLLLAENGLTDTNVKYQIFSAAPGYGDKTIEELSKDTDYYNRLIATVQKAYDIAHAQGKVFIVPAISWAQGRSTNSDSTYYDLLETLRADIDADVKAITGQTIPVKLIAWQAVFGNTTPKRFYDRFVYASEKYENIICSGTFYNYEHVASNNLHLTANSQDWLGCQFGIAYKRTIIDGAKFIPLKPKKAQVYGNIVYVDFYVPVKPLKFDTTLVAEATNKGFQIIDANSTEKTITAVEIVSPDRVKLVCSSDVDPTDHIVYGNVGGTDYSPTTGKRGNLRDSQSIIYKNHNNVDLPCYNWCVVFDKTIAELSV